MTASTTTGQCVLFYATWNSGSITTVVPASVNHNTIASGKDFCLDNLKMETVPPNTAPLLSSLLLLASSLGSVGLSGVSKKALCS